MAELKLGTQIGGNLVWHQGILDLNPVDDKLFFRQFDVITDIGGQTINGGLSLKGDVDTTGRMVGVGANGGWGSASRGAFSQIIENDTSAHWLLTSNRKDGSGRAGIQVLTSNTGIMRLYTDNITKYVDIAGGQVSVQATMPSSASHLTRKDYVDAEVKRSMDYTDSKDAASNATVTALDTRVTTLDAQNVKITGNQNIAGIKTFSSHITVPAADPTAATQAAHKGYVDKLNATSVKGVTAISPIISTGGINPVISIAPASRASSGSMSSNDKIKLDDLPADALSRAGGTMNPNGFIKLDGMGGINSITGGKEYSIFRDHNNGNVTVGGAGGDLYLGYTTDSEAYTTQNVLLYAPLKWMNNKTGRVLVDSDGFIPWASIKDRIGLEGKSKPLKGPINFDDLNLTGDYNLYNAKKTGSVNPPPFNYGTMSVVGSEKDGNTFVTQIATDKSSGVTYIRTRSDDGTWTAWNKQYSEQSKPTPAEVGAVNKTGDIMTGNLTTPKVLVSGAQGTESNALTRRDYVDTQLSGKLNTYGGTITGPLRIEAGVAKLVFADDTGSDLAILHDDSYTAFREGEQGVDLLALEGGMTPTVTMRNPRAALAQEQLPQSLTRKDYVDSAIAAGDALQVSKSGDNMTGNLTVPKVLLSAAQGSEVNALTRKDYVDAIDAKNVAKAGDTMTGTLNAPDFIQTTAQSTNAAASTRKDYVDAQVGAVDAKNVAKTGDTMTGLLKSTVAGNAINLLGGNIRSNTAQVMSLDGSRYAFVTSISDVHLCQNSYWDGVSWKKYDNAAVSAQIVIGAGSARIQTSAAGATNPIQNTYDILHTGNITPAHVLPTNVSWTGRGIENLVNGCIAWRNYGSGHVIFDASSGKSPTGEAVNNTNPVNDWSATYPTLMGWNGVTTYGVRVARAKTAEATINGLTEGGSHGTLTLSNWIRTTGDSGLFCATYGGGIHMQDTTWVRTYNSKKFYVSNTDGDAIHTAGGMKANGNGSFNDVQVRSDERLKSNYQPITSALDKVDHLAGITYDKIGKTTREAGIIAQRLKEVLPEATGVVFDSMDADAIEYLTISNSGVNALLVEAIKELRAEVNQLRQQIAK